MERGDGDATLEIGRHVTGPAGNKVGERGRWARRGGRRRQVLEEEQEDEEEGQAGGSGPP